MNDMNLETPVRTDESDTLVVTDDRARRRKRIAIIGAAVIAMLAIVIALMMTAARTRALEVLVLLPAARLPTVSVIVPGRTQVASHNG
jgi:HlyD family secretion protein